MNKYIESKAMCSCLKIKYDPEIDANGRFTDRWRCEQCGFDFRRKNIVICEHCKEVVEIYVGMDGGFEPKTAPEAYLFKILKDMYDEALKCFK